MDVVYKIAAMDSGYSETYGEYEEIIFDGIPPELIREGDEIYVMNFVRFDTDTLTFDFVNKDVSSAKIPMIELQRELQSLVI